MTALAVGLRFNSLAAGLGGFILLLCMSFRKKSQQSLAFFYSVAWGALAFFLIQHTDPSEPIAWFLAGGFAFAMSLGAHICAFQWLRDFE